MASLSAMYHVSENLNITSASVMVCRLHCLRASSDMRWLVEPLSWMNRNGINAIG